MYICTSHLIGTWCSGLMTWLVEIYSDTIISNIGDEKVYYPTSLLNKNKETKKQLCCAKY